MPSKRDILSTANRFTAGRCGYERPMDPVEDGYGWTLSESGGEYTLRGPDGCVTLGAVEFSVLVEHMTGELRFKRGIAA
jgi:hypothetical protein